MTDSPDWFPVADRINPSVLVTGTPGSSTSPVPVADTSLLRPGDWVAIYSTSMATVALNGVYQVKSISGGQVQLTTALATIPNSGDTMVLLPTVNIVTANPGQGIQSFITPSPFAWSVVGSFSVSTLPTISITPPTGSRVVVANLDVEANQSGAAAWGTDVTLSGPTTGTRWQGKISVGGTVGNVDRTQRENVGYQFIVNEVVTLKAAASTSSSVFCDMSMAGWYD